AGVEDVRDADAVLIRQILDLGQHRGERGPGYHAVLDDVVRADPADRGECGLPASPERGPLGGVYGGAYLECIVGAADRVDGGVFRGHLGGRTVDLDHENGAGAGRVPAVDCLLRGGDRDGEGRGWKRRSAGGGGGSAR